VIGLNVLLLILAGVDLACDRLAVERCQVTLVSSSLSWLGARRLIRRYDFLRARISEHSFVQAL
jgi:hypothetical protein